MSEALYKKAIERWGPQAQKVMAIEEFSELIHELSRNLNGKTSNIEEEMADAWIMLEQLMLLVDLDEVSHWKTMKLKRLKKILDGKVDYQVDEFKE